jgi:hypothetical protein
MKIKVLVNASTLVIGGGIQIGASFIEYFDNWWKDHRHLFIQEQVKEIKEISKQCYFLGNYKDKKG